ncbi:MAG: antibiotic biosynthesis monooxygenase [Chloroflexi bacterium]|nr:MAG: antibiotic biosynthesis monooxygenase [Chloroflexota bacterium]
MTIMIAGRVKIKAEKRAIAVVQAIEFAKLSREEAGCIRYEFYVDISDPNTFFVFGQWESQEALDRHVEAEHTKAMDAKLAEYAAKDPEISRYVVDEEAAL